MSIPDRVELVRWSFALMVAAVVLGFPPLALAEVGSKAPPVKLDVEVVTSTAGVDAALVEDSARAKLGKVKRCFEQAIERDLRPWGSVTVNLLVAKSGRVAEATVGEDTLGDRRLGRCLVRRALELRLPSKAFEMNSRVGLAYRFNELRRRRRASTPRHAKAAAPPGGAGQSGVLASSVGSAASTRSTLSRTVIQRHIRRHIRAIRFCYEAQLLRNPGLSGLVSVRFAISPSGAVSSASVASSTLGSEVAETCIVRAVQRIDFPALEGEAPVVVTYPFRFDSTQ